ncbi:MAG TPA: pyridoxamine 5'-phosphate oxidase [Chryseosolibacter sp.]
MQDIANIRKDYRKATVDVSNVDPHPVKQFEKWFGEALKSEVIEPNAMTLATIDEHGTPSARVVLLKGLENNCFIFYTNYQSDKGRQLEKNPACALTFFWPELERQVRVKGIASRVAPSLSDTYFQSRPRESQIGAWASPQSSMIGSRSILEQRYRDIEKKFEGYAALPRPQQWGGYQVDPFEVEFWQGGPGRLHDRIQYAKVDDAWKIHRLAP